MAWVRRSFSSRAENARQSSRLFSTGRAADSQRNIAGSVTTCLVSQSDCRCIEPAGGAPILRILFAALIALALLTSGSATQPSSGMRRRPTILYFIATAYSVEGTGASGKWSHPGTVAADRKVLPLNSRIRIYGAGRYSGDYTVEDTGGKVDGHHIDVYMPSQAEAKKFGRQRVKVVVLKYGDDEASPPDPQQKAEAKAVNRKVRAKANAAPTK
jgi:3D (Asp-Asp-Asp) domain-containing protein